MAPLLAPLLLAGTARADRYWDLEADAAEAIVASLAPGSLVVTWCAQCGGDLRVMRVRSARVAPGTYADGEGRRSVVLERELLFAGTNPKEPALPEAARCGAEPGAWVDAQDGSGPGLSEHLDVPYSFLLDDKGRLTWLGETVAADFGDAEPPRGGRLAAPFLARVKACAADAVAGRLTMPGQAPTTPAGPPRP